MCACIIHVICNTPRINPFVKCFRVFTRNVPVFPGLMRIMRDVRNTQKCGMRLHRKPRMCVCLCVVCIVSVCVCVFGFPKHNDIHSVTHTAALIVCKCRSMSSLFASLNRQEGGLVGGGSGSNMRHRRRRRRRHTVGRHAPAAC